ncbi:MAG TPA: response regulator transcription factor, partial [Bacillota bacterium]|nr:response regulator transcription factor [Bacillota bacterium]
ADDYMTKPFAIEELLARIRGALKRKMLQSQSSSHNSNHNGNYNGNHNGNLSSNHNANLITVDLLVIDQDRRAVSYDGQRVELTKKEFDLLAYLAENRNVVLTRDKILETVWGYDYYGDTNIVDVYIRYLRSKLDDRFNTKLIHTIRGVGYSLRYE